jgi:hypothetical protein
MHAGIGVLQALNRNVERVFKNGEKQRNWGKRKLAQDLSVQCCAKIQTPPALNIRMGWRRCKLKC